MATIVNIGPPQKTRVHDYQLFYFNVLWNVAFAAVIWFLWEEGTIDFWLERFTLHYNIAFAVLYVFGAAWSNWVTWKISRAFNALKDGRLDSQEMLQCFGVEYVQAPTIEFKKEIVRNELANLIEKLQYVAYLAVLVGIFGTIDGLTQTFDTIAQIKMDSLMQLISEMGKHLVLYGTSMPALVVYVMVSQYYRVARRGAYKLYHRIGLALEAGRT